MRGPRPPLTELDPQTTITSVDGVGAFDLISRRAMLLGLREVEAAVVPFARLFCVRSEYLWDNDLGEIHTISQGENGKQGDAMMPLLYSPGQHQSHLGQANAGLVLWCVVVCCVCLCVRVCVLCVCVCVWGVWAVCV